LHHAGLILIEEAGSGIQLIQDLKASTRLSVKGILPKDDKATRMLSVSHLIEAGRIAIPADAPWRPLARGLPARGHPLSRRQARRSGR